MNGGLYTMAAQDAKNGKKIVPRGDPALHGNSARIDPKKELVSDYQFYSVTPVDQLVGEARLPVAEEETVRMAKREVDANKK